VDALPEPTSHAFPEVPLLMRELLHRVYNEFTSAINVVSIALAINSLRNEGLTRALSDSEVERLFALSFALEQLHHNLIDLARCVREWTGDVRAKATA
jgi:two-component sensor histidine kinase